MARRRPTVTDIAANLAAVRARVAAAADRVGRHPSSIRLLPISKTVPAERLRAAAAAGLTTFGENKIQEAETKAEALLDLGLAWSVVGHLQTNKAKAVARFASEFQALDSLRVAEALDRALSRRERTLEVFIQVNTSGEATKFGLDPADVAAFVDALGGFNTLRLKGLMTLAAFTPDVTVVRGCFRRLVELGVQTEQGLGRAVDLSMGMSGDFETAIEEGATVVRVGQAIFGRRATPDADYWPGFAGR